MNGIGRRERSYNDLRWAKVFFTLRSKYQDIIIHRSPSAIVLGSTCPRDRTTRGDQLLTLHPNLHLTHCTKTSSPPSPFDSSQKSLRSPYTKSSIPRPRSEAVFPPNAPRGARNSDTPRSPGRREKDDSDGGLNHLLSSYLQPDLICVMRLGLSATLLLKRRRERVWV